MEKGKKIKVIKNKKERSSKFNFKSYIKDFILFVDKKMLKTIGALVVVSILLISLSIQPMIAGAKLDECEGACRDGITIFSEYGNKIQVLFVTALAGMVPYLYAPIVGFVASLMSEVSNIAYIIKGYGYFAGITMGIIPLLINVLVICIVTAIGIYICRTVMVGYKISNIKNMNATNFKIKLYEAMRKTDKVKELTKKKEEKLKKLQDKKEKINYIQILNTAIIVCILQFISVLIQHILI